MLNCDFKSCGFESHYLPYLYFFKKQKIKNLTNISDVKKINSLNFKFFSYSMGTKILFLFKPIFTYYNFFYKKNDNFLNSISNGNFIFLFNKKKWHYNFNLLKNNKTLFFFTLGSILKYLKIETKSLRRSKKGFLIYLNVIFNILKRFAKHRITVLLNFFDNKTFFFRSRLNKYYFSRNLLIKMPFSSYNSKFKKHKSIKRRLTKKFIKKI